jgi:hypothetical protein
VAAAQPAIVVAHCKKIVHRSNILHATNQRALSASRHFLCVAATNKYQNSDPSVAIRKNSMPACSEKRGLNPSLSDGKPEKGPCWSIDETNRIRSVLFGVQGRTLS